MNFNYMSTRNERTSVHYLSKENASYSLQRKQVCVRERENVIHGMCALKLDACVNSAGGKVFMKTSIFQSLTRETVLCNKKTC